MASSMMSVARIGARCSPVARPCKAAMPMPMTAVCGGHHGAISATLGLRRSMSSPLLAARPATDQAARHPVACKADNGSSGEQSTESGLGVNIVSVGLLVLWLALGTYALTMSPNQTPYRDQIFIKLLTGITSDPTFKVNQVYFSIFNIIGIYTFMFQCLLIPGGRSGNKIPAWPFVVASYGLGCFALLPYMALQTPLPGNVLPPPKEELEGWNKLAMKGAETTVLPGIALAGATYLLYNMFSASGAAWLDYIKLFDESRLVHISTIDLCVLATLCPYWMSNDAELRGWKDREKLLPILSVLPVVGPATYLLLRPKTGDEEEAS